MVYDCYRSHPAGQFRSRVVYDCYSPNLQSPSPPRLLRELERLLAKRDRDETIALYGNPSQLMFELDDWRLTSRKLEGNYPNYHQLIPQEFAYHVTLEMTYWVMPVQLCS